MKQSNTYHLRKFIERASAIGPNQTMMITQKEALDISFALNDQLLYQGELEDEVRDLRNQLANVQSITIEMQGDKF